MFKASHRFIMILTLSSNAFASGQQCISLFADESTAKNTVKDGELLKQDRELKLIDQSPAKIMKNEAVASGKRIDAFFKAASNQILERNNVLNSLLVSMIAKEHLLMVGPPGNAKTTLTKLIFENIKEKSTGKESFFATQMTAETSLSDTHGGINYKTLQETGKQERLYEEGILGARVAMLDEQFDMRPNGYRNILDVLAERAHAQSGKKHKGKTWTVVGASNTFIPEVYAKFDGSDQPRALIDRYSYVLFIPAEMQKATSNRSIIQGAQKTREKLPEVFFEDFEAVQKLVPEVVIPDYVSDMLSLVQYKLRTIFEAKEEASLQEYKEKIQAGEKPLAPYKSTKYMSPRTLGKAAGVLRAVVALDYATKNGQRKLSAQIKDLNALVDFYSLGGPDEQFIQSQMKRASKEVEKDQLKTILWERKVVRETLADVMNEFNQKITEMGSQDLYAKVRQYNDLSSGERRELIDTLRTIYTRKLEIDQLPQEDITPAIIAEVSLADLAMQWVKVIEPNKADQIIQSWNKSAPVTKKKNTDGRYVREQQPTGSFGALTQFVNKAKAAAHKAADAVREVVQEVVEEVTPEAVNEHKTTVETVTGVDGKQYNAEATEKLSKLGFNTNSINDFKNSLDQGADPNVTRPWGIPILTSAASYGKVELVKLFLEHGADTKIESTADGKILDAKGWAKRYGNLEIVKIIEEHEAKLKAEKKTISHKIDLANPQSYRDHMVFHEIKPGKFLMGDAQVETEITKPFEMMATQVTQKQWATLQIAMGEKDVNKINPSHFKDGTDSTTVSIEGIDVQMKPDHPVEKVSYDDVKTYIDGLNRLSNQGDLKTQELLRELIPGHKKGDIYDLPTEAQWEFVMRDRGNANKKHFDRDDEADLPKYAWFAVNSGNETHAVATLQPRMIDASGDGIRRSFYDLEGNVWEWNKDFYDGALKGGQDPQVPPNGSYRVIRGGGWYSYAQYLRSGDRSSRSSGDRRDNLGFRLVRTRP